MIDKEYIKQYFEQNKHKKVKVNNYPTSKYNGNIGIMDHIFEDTMISIRVVEGNHIGSMLTFNVRYLQLVTDNANDCLECGAKGEEMCKPGCANG